MHVHLTIFPSTFNSLKVIKLFMFFQFSIYCINNLVSPRPEIKFNCNGSTKLCAVVMATTFPLHRHCQHWHDAVSTDAMLSAWTWCCQHWHDSVNPYTMLSVLARCCAVSTDTMLFQHWHDAVSTDKILSAMTRCCQHWHFPASTDMMLITFCHH